MSDRTVNTHARVTKFSTIAGALLMALLFGTGKAHALNEFFSPWGPTVSVRIFVGKRASDNSIRLIYMTGLSGWGACSASTKIGVNGTLLASTLIHGSDKDDELVIPWGFQWPVCGETLQDPGSMGGNIEFWMEKGFDTVYGNNNPNAKYDLGETSGGDASGELFFAGRAKRVVGSNGPDTIMARGVAAPAMDAYGLLGDDRFCSVEPWHIIDGGGLGSDDDRSFGGAANVVDIEYPMTLPESWCEAMEVSLWNAIND